MNAEQMPTEVIINWGLYIKIAIGIIYLIGLRASPYIYKQTRKNHHYGDDDQFLGVLIGFTWPLVLLGLLVELIVRGIWNGSGYIGLRILKALGKE